VSTYRDPVTRFVYDPSSVGVSSPDDLRDALTRHGLAIQPVRHTHVWSTLCDTLLTRYEGDPRVLLESCHWDVARILATLRADRVSLPVISGPKMSNYWLFILSRFTDATFTNPHEISIIPDIHVRRASVRLGVIGDPLAPTTEELADIWRAGLAGTRFSPSELHGPLWCWSRAGFPELS
jgi:hypothetical protein